VARQLPGGPRCGGSVKEVSAPVVYLDHAATTPVRPEVLDAMMPFFTTDYANPSGSHRFARQVRQAVDEARDVVARAVGCDPGEVVFTGCGTESDNMAILGALGSGRALCHAAEHHAVLHVVERVGGTVIGTDECARMDRAALMDALETQSPSGAVDGSAPTAVDVVSVMAVNNEVGTIENVRDVARAVRSRAPGALVHTDAVQAACWLDLHELWRDVDLMSISAHKFGGPKGVGALIVRSGVRLEPLLVGGGQERERRSGTLNVAGIVGLATALDSTVAERDAMVGRVADLRDRFVDALLGALDDVAETVPRADKVAGSAHVCIAGVENEALLFLLDEEGVCASAASACASGAMEPSHVLAAMGVSRALAGGALRATLGRTTTEEDIDRATDVIVGAVRALRARARR
jgi:cysteine desulfurase